MTYRIDDYITSNNPVAAVNQSFDGLRTEIIKVIKHDIVGLRSKHTSYANALCEFLVMRNKEFRSWRKTAKLITQHWIDKYPDEPVVASIVQIDLFDMVDELFNDVWSFTPRFRRLAS